MLTKFDDFLFESAPRIPSSEEYWKKKGKSGKDVYEQILPIVISINKYLLESISKDEIELLDSILERMQQQANKLDMRGLPLANRRSGSLRFRS